MKKLSFFTATFLIAGTTASAGCANFEDGSMTSPAPKYRICYDDVCEETQLSWVCSNIHGTQHRYANGWATDYTSPHSGEESYTVTWQGRTIDEEKHSRLSIEEIDWLENPIAEDSAVVLAKCLAAADKAIDCLGVIQKIEVSENGCSEGQDPTECWAVEAAAWDVPLAREMTIAIEAVAILINQDFANDLQAAQDNWHNTRDGDCKVYWPLLFSPDGGAAFCRADYAAKRIDFLRDVVSRSEFQG